VNLKKIQDLPELPKEIKDYYDMIISGDIAHNALPIGVVYAIDLEARESVMNSSDMYVWTAIGRITVGRRHSSS
jgi:hypothetical protein